MHQSHEPFLDYQWTGDALGKPKEREIELPMPMPKSPPLQNERLLQLQDENKVNPTTLIEATVTCQDGSTWPAYIHTNVVDGPAESSSLFVVDFMGGDRDKALRIRLDAAHITDIKATSEAGSSGLSYFVLASLDGIVVGNEDFGVQGLPDRSGAVVHVSSVKSGKEARNFFAELMILAQFLAAKNGGA